MGSRAVLELVGSSLVLLRLLSLALRVQRLVVGSAGPPVDPLAAAFHRDLRRRGLLPSSTAESG
jgi:hypothetical protein